MRLVGQDLRQGFGVIVSEWWYQVTIWPRESLCDVVDQREDSLSAKS